MAEIVNLRRARKQKRRTEKETDAAANRLKHGHSKSERTKAKLSRALTDKRLEDHRRHARAENTGES